MRTIGLAYVSYWGDQVEDVSCGHSIFLTDLILQLDKMDYYIYSLHEDLDHGDPVFKNFRPEDRQEAYDLQAFDDEGFPELDILLLEWRFPWPGKPSKDLDRQEKLLQHYHNHTKTKIFILDTDYKLTKEDEERFPNAIIVDVATNSKLLSRKRLGLYFPFDMDIMKQRENIVHAPLSYATPNSYPLDPSFVVSYIGNDYERENQFTKYIHGISNKLKWGFVHVYGNWLKYPDKIKPNIAKYPNIVFHPKVTKGEMEYIYSRSLCVPLLSKDDYAEHGQLAYRILEVMYNGGIPVGLKEFHNIEKYVIPELIVGDVEELYSLIVKLMNQTHEERTSLWKKQVNHFDYSPKEFIYALER